MSLPSYVINFDELKELLEDKFSNIVIKDLSSLYGLQKIKGFHLGVPAIRGRYRIVDFITPSNIVITGVTYSQSAWKPIDYWELFIGEEKLFDTIYTKEIATQKNWKIIQPVNQGTKIELILNNNSGNSRDVWVDLEYVNLTDIIEGNR